MKIWQDMWLIFGIFKLLTKDERISETKTLGTIVYTAPGKLQFVLDYPITATYFKCLVQRENEEESHLFFHAQGKFIPNAYLQIATFYLGLNIGGTSYSTLRQKQLSFISLRVSDRKVLFFQGHQFIERGWIKSESYLKPILESQSNPNNLTIYFMKIEMTNSIEFYPKNT